MTPIRAAAGLLARLLTWSLVAASPSAAPVPYTQLVQRERPSRPKPRPRPRPALSPTATATRPASPVASAVAGVTTGMAATATGQVVTPLPPPAGPPAARPAVAKAALSPELPMAAAPALSAAPTGARLPPGAPIPAVELESFVDGAVRQAMATEPVAGLAIAVVQNGQLVLEKGYGLARRSPAIPVNPRATTFRLGSVSKVFTWIEVLKAVEAGRLRLDEPVNARLPPALRIPDDNFDTPVRLRNLMTHDAGWESREFGRLFRAEARPLDETLRADRPKRVRAPGELPTYSSYGAALAGRLAAQAAWRPFDDLVETDLLRPAGLASTTFREPDAGREGVAAMPDALAGRLAEGYAWTRTGFERQPFGFAGGLAPALSASSTADDMARLMLALLGGGRVGGDSAPLWGPRTDAALRTPLTPGWAHGLMAYDLPGGFRGFGHDGAAPGFRARLVTVPQLGLGVFIAGNSDTAERVTSRVPELLIRHFYAGPAVQAAPVAADASDYSGLYVSTRRTYHGVEGLVGRLTRLFSVKGEPGGGLVVWGPDGGRRFVATAERGRFTAADDAGAPLTFKLGPDGRASAFLSPGGAEGAERVDLLHQPALLASAAAVAGAASLLAVAGLFVRDAREHRQSGRQAVASRVQALTALLWLGSLAAFTAFALTGAAEGRLQRDWPNAWLVGASSAALAAAILTALQIVQLPGAWREERRGGGWTAGRKLRHTTSVLAFAAFAVVLLGWGALEPWSS